MTDAPWRRASPINPAEQNAPPPADAPSPRWLLVTDGPPDPSTEPAVVFPLTDDPAALEALAKKYGDRLAPAGERVQRAMIDLRDDLARWCERMADAPAPDGLFAALDGDPAGVNGWWFTLLGERNPGKTDAFLKIAHVAAVQTLLDERPVDGLILRLGDGVAVDALAALARRRGLALRRGGAAAAAPGRTRRRVRAFLRALKWGLRAGGKHLAARWVLGPRPAGTAVDATIVTYFPYVDADAAAGGRFRNAYAPELQTLFENQNRSLGWLLIAVPRPGQNFLEALRLGRRLRRAGAVLAFWEEFAGPGLLWRAFRDWRRAARAATDERARDRAARATADGPLPEAGPILAELFRESVEGVDGFSGRVYHRAFREFFNGSAAGDVIYFAECHGWERALAAARGPSRDGKLIAYQHAAVGTNELNYYTAPWENRAPAPVPDVWVANGSVTEDLLRRAGHGRVVRAEALRHLSLGRRARRPVNTARAPAALALSGIDWRESRRLMAWLLWGRAAGFGIRWRVRLHPSADRRRVLRGWAPALLRDFDLDSPTPTHVALEGVAVAVAGSTSMALDALALGCRVVVPVFAGGLSLSPLLEAVEVRDVVDSPAALHRIVVERANAPFDLAAATRGRAFVERYWEMDERLPRWNTFLGEGVLQ